MHCISSTKFSFRNGNSIEVVDPANASEENWETIIAENIEDFQCSFELDDGTKVNVSTQLAKFGVTIYACIAAAKRRGITNSIAGPVIEIKKETESYPMFPNVSFA